MHKIASLSCRPDGLYATTTQIAVTCTDNDFSYSSIGFSQRNPPGEPHGQLATPIVIILRDRLILKRLVEVRQ